VGRDIAFAILLALCVLAAFWPALDNGFVSFDDGDYVADNAHVERGLTWEGLRWALGATHSNNWHPLTWLSHMLDSELFGPNPRGHHAVSVLLHALNAVLLFAFLRRATTAFWAAALTAALFALHPLRVESVAWISERKDLLAGLFFMLGLLAHLRYARGGSRVARAGVALCMALGLLAKPMLVTLPAVLLLLDYWPLGRWRPAGEAPEPATLPPHAVHAPPVPSSQLLLEKLPLFALALASALVTLAVQSTTGATQSLDAISLSARLANALVSYVAYLGMSAWPTGLAFFYPHASLVSPDAGLQLALTGAGAAAVLALISVAAWRSRRSAPHLLVGWLWYLVTLLPVIGLLQVGTQARADRYTYLPTIGIAIALAWALQRWACAPATQGEEAASSRDPGIAPRAWIAGTTCLAVLAALALATSAQTRVWRDSFTLYEHALRATRDNYLAANNLGAAHARAGRFGLAAEHYRLSLGLRPEHAEAHNNLGIALERLGDTVAARRHYEQALLLLPDFDQAHVNLGGLDASQDRYAAALAHYAAALPERPDDAALHLNIAGIQVHEGRRREAEAHYQAALELEPGLADARLKYGLALEGWGEAGAAVVQYREALRHAPNLLPAIQRLAWLLATSSDDRVRDGEEALLLAQRGAEATRHRKAELLVTLAAAHAENGHFDEAQRWQTRAIQLTPRDHRAPLERQLELYLAARPYRERPPR